MQPDERDDKAFFANPAIWAFFIGVILLIIAAIVYAFVKGTWYFWVILAFGIVFIVIGIVWFIITELRNNRKANKSETKADDDINTYTPCQSGVCAMSANKATPLQDLAPNI